jgi:3-methyladenine DNA glycosylase/8-oxoguanine DNA glycosylase
MNSHPGWSEAERHLTASDARLAELMAQAGPCRISPPKRFPVFPALASSIVYQQLAGSAAAAILGRVQALFPRRQMTPVRLLELDETLLRGAGLSAAKLVALRDLAAKCLDGTVPTVAAMARMDDEEIIERVSQVRGIGRWTVEMMLIFDLGRPNVLPVDDYGVRKGMQRLYRMRELPDKHRMRRQARKWHPWCSVASWYMWRASEQATAKEKQATKKRSVKKKSAKKKIAKKAAVKKAAAGTKAAAKKVKRNTQKA